MATFLPDCRKMTTPIGLLWWLLLYLASIGAVRSTSLDIPFPTLVPWMGMYQPKNDSFNDDQCVNDSKLLKASFEDRMLWAVRMADASVTRVSGALWGIRYQLGSFDACMSTSAGSPVGAQYCLVRVTVHLPDNRDPPRRPENWTCVHELPPYEDAAVAINGAGLLPDFYKPGDVLVAQCVPASCRPAALEAALRASLGPGVTAEVEPRLCTAPHSPEKSTAFLLFWCLVASLTALTAAAPVLGWSWWDYRRHMGSLLRPDPPLEGMDLSYLSGMRFLTAMLLTIAHRGVLDSRGALANQPVDAEASTSLLYTFVFHGQIFNSTCLFLSGVLTMLCKTKHSILRTLLIRVLRLAPAYLLMIFFTSAVLPSLGSGPLWQLMMGWESEACTNRWWANLLFINNYTPRGVEQPGCLFHSWYLAVEMQLFVACLLLRPHERGWRFMVTCLVLSVLPPLLGTLHWQLPAIAPIRPIRVQRALEDPWLTRGYFPTHMRATPFVVGLAAGKLLMQLKQRPGFRLSMPATLMVTACSSVVLIGVQASGSLLQDPHRRYSPLEAALFAGLSPTLWAAALGTLLVALVFGERTYASVLLSWQPLITLSRMTYGLYLISFLLQTATVAARTEAKKLWTLSVISDLFSDAGISFFSSFALHILVEAPARLATRDLLERDRTKVLDSSSNSSQISTKKER